MDMHQDRMKKVEFLSERYKLVGNLFRPDKLKESDRLPAVVVAGPMTGVKERLPACGLNALPKPAL
jgi:hypothetical protein